MVNEMQIRATLASILIAAAMSAPAEPALGADLGPTPYVIETDQLRADLERYAALYLLRVGFDVMQANSIPDYLVEAASDLQSGERSSIAAQLNEALTAEGSYYIVSLSYLVGSGGANWPDTRPPETYERDALFMLAGLQHDWLQAVADGSDLLPLLTQLDQINAKTEGYDDVPAHLDHFAPLSELVDGAIARAGLATSP